jgi:glycosyltransferase involved in cell wall biosynthesis
MHDARPIGEPVTGKRERIVHITAVHTGDDIRIFQKECRSLAQNGYDVYLIAPNARAGCAGGVTLVSMPKYRNRLVRMSLGCWHAFVLAMGLRADLYHLHDPELLPWGQLLRLFGKKVVFDMHENLPGAILDKGWLPHIVRRPLSLAVVVLEWMLLIGMPIIFAEDSYVKHYSRSRKSAVVLNMPLLDELRSIRVPARPEPTIGYFGAVSHLRGSIVLIEALKLLKEQGCHAGLELIGPIQDAHRREIGDLVQTYGLQRVNVRGYMEAHQGWEIMAGCTLGTALLAPVPNYMGSYPTKIFEYMCLGIPVLSSDFPLYKTIVEELKCGYCIDPRSPQDVANAIRRLIDDPALAHSLGENGRAAVAKHFNWSNELEKLEGLYRRVLKNGGRSVRAA